MNISLRLPEEYYDKVRAFLKDRGFEERKIEYAIWSLCREGTCATLYRSGSLLLQGNGALFLKEEILSLMEEPSGVQIGCDESGKGDVFGPLVLCCVIIPPSYYKKVLSLAPKDCKLLKDEVLLKKVEALFPLVEVKCLVYEPEQLNELYSEVRNLNRIMDRAYRTLIEDVRKHYHVEITIDAYSSQSPFGKGVVFKKKGERDVAVSVASMFARARFLLWIREHNLPKGAGKDAIAKARTMLKDEPHKAKKFLKVFFLEG